MQRAAHWLMVLFALLSVAAQPADGMLLAYRNVMGLSDADRVDSRYLWVSNGDSKQRYETFVATSGHLQGLSLGRRIVPPVMVLDDGQERQWPFVARDDWAKVVLFRVALSKYRFDPKVWDRLGDPALEPWFHVRTQVPYPAGVNADGSTYKAGSESAVAFAPWLLRPLPVLTDDPVYRNASLVLSRVCGYSACPILEVDNFIWQTAIQFDRKAGYYDFIGTKDLKDFYELVGFDEKQSLRFAFPLLEAVSKSGVAQEPRRIEAWEKIGGRLYLTKDQVNQRGIKTRNPLNVLGRNDLDFDAFEFYGMGANGWWKNFLATNKGVRQDSAPDGIGYFHQSVTNDGKIHVYLTCNACHDKQPGNGGLKPFRPFFRNQFAAPGPLALNAKTPKQLIGFEDEYLSAWDAAPDQQRYIAAVFEATGTTPDVFSEHLLNSFLRADRHVDLSLAAERCGVSDEEFIKALNRQKDTYGIISNVSGNYLRPKERRDEIGVNQWAEDFNQQQLAMRGLPTWPPELRVRYSQRPK